MAAMIGREILTEEPLSSNYSIRSVRRRRTGQVTWEVIDAQTGRVIAAELLDAEEARRIVYGFEGMERKGE